MSEDLQNFGIWYNEYLSRYLGISLLVHCAPKLPEKSELQLVSVTACGAECAGDEVAGSSIVTSSNLLLLLHSAAAAAVCLGRNT